MKTEVKCGCMTCEKSHSESRVRCVHSTTTLEKFHYITATVPSHSVTSNNSQESIFCSATSQTREYPPGSFHPTKSIIDKMTSIDGPWVLWSLTSLCSQNLGSSSTGHSQGEDEWVWYVLLCHVRTPVVSNICVRNVWF